ncbi:MAG TPA: DNA recombination protein RmuC, partial [Eubacteriales bacterium]|nr:DNA recombination protein RmuC [Eubacteriales bacterium]
DRLDQKFEKFKDETVRQLTESRKAYEEQLQKIRETVDEKLTSTIEQRFKNSFTLISGRLEEINKGFQELQVLQSKVGDLNRIFSNVKTSGTWGEVSLENLLSQILTPDQFERQVNLTRGSDSDENRVDFAVKLPGKESGTVKLPIDAKFPSERYFQLIDAAERGSLSEVEATRRDFFDAVKKMARDISQRYIKIGKTTDFAIMYLPVEGMFAEVAKEAGLLEKLQNDYRVVVTGPTTLAALLNSLQMGFRTLAIEKRSAEIQSLFDHFKRDFATFSELLAKTQKKLSEISNTIEQADKRTKIIGKALDKVSAIPLPKAALELAEDSEVAAEMPEWDIETEDETA